MALTASTDIKYCRKCCCSLTSVDAFCPDCARLDGAFSSEIYHSVFITAATMGALIGVVAGWLIWGASP